MSSIYYLYLKTHNITGLKYLGQTKQDPFKYSGSGKYWKNHLKIHGNDVSTEVLGQYYTKEELKEAGLYFSNLWNIIESKDFANLTLEEGSGGFTWTDDKKHILKNIGYILGKNNKNIIRNKKFKDNLSKKWSGENNPCYGLTKENHPAYGHKAPWLTKLNLSRKKKVNTPDGIFNSIKEAANYYNRSTSFIEFRAKSTAEKWKQYYYILPPVSDG